MKMLSLFAAAGKIHFKIESIFGPQARIGAIESDKGWHFCRQALLEIGCFKRSATHGDGAMFGRNSEPDRRQWRCGTIGANARINTNAHFGAGRNFNFAPDRFVLRIGLRIGLAKSITRARANRHDEDDTPRRDH